MSVINPGQLRVWKSPWAEKKGHRTGMFNNDDVDLVVQSDENSYYYSKRRP